MKNDSIETRRAAQLLGKRGGTATLRKYGAKRLKEWGKLGAEFGKRGGRPRKRKSPKGV